MKQIPLTQNKFTLVDDEDFEYLSQWKWQFGGHRYAVRTINHSQKLYMHRIILNAPKDKQIDHINHNELDNRKNNLRLVTIQQNFFNSLPHKDSISGLKGVYLRRKDQKWIVYLKRKFIGSFLSKIEAAEAYNRIAKKEYGKYAYLNII